MLADCLPLRADVGADDYAPKVRVSIPPGGPQPMTRADICNVGAIDLRRLLEVLDDASEAADVRCEVA